MYADRWTLGKSILWLHVKDWDTHGQCQSQIEVIQCSAEHTHPLSHDPRDCISSHLNIKCQTVMTVMLQSNWSRHNTGAQWPQCLHLNHKVTTNVNTVVTIIFSLPCLEFNLAEIFGFLRWNFLIINGLSWASPILMGRGLPGSSWKNLLSSDYMTEHNAMIDVCYISRNLRQQRKAWGNCCYLLELAQRKFQRRHLIRLFEILNSMNNQGLQITMSVHSKTKFWSKLKRRFCVHSACLSKLHVYVTFTSCF